MLQLDKFGVEEGDHAVTNINGAPWSLLVTRLEKYDEYQESEEKRRNVRK